MKKIILKPGKERALQRRHPWIFSGALEPVDRSIAEGDLVSVHNSQGRFDQALVYLRQALTIAREIGDRGGEGRVLNNIARIHNTQGRYDQALEYLSRF